MVLKITKNKAFILIIILILSFILIYLINNKTKTNQDSKVSIFSPNVSITPTPFLFQEYTIPYLRLRNYQSSLAERELAYERPSYTAYLTSYTSDNFKVNGLLTIPKGEVPESGFGAIVFIHGYIPPTQYQTLQNYADYVDYLAKNGFVVFKIDLRGHGNSEGEASGAYYSSDYIVDVLNAHNALSKEDYVNAEKIGLWGHSMAGNVVFRSLATKPDIPAVSIWAGAVYTYDDFKEYGINDGSYRPPASDSNRQRKRQQLFDTYGEFNSDSQFWQQVAPTNYLADIKGAVQLNHAVNDNVVSINYSRNLNSVLNDSQIPHELKEYSDGGHNISGASFNLAMQNTVAFFKKYLDR